MMLAGGSTELAGRSPDLAGRSPELGRRRKTVAGLGGLDQRRAAGPWAEDAQVGRGPARVFQAKAVESCCENHAQVSGKVVRVKAVARIVGLRPSPSLG